MGHVICIASQKGGTGKTTTAVNMAASFALFEKKTLIVDCDPLGNATTAFGINKVKVSRGLFHALTGNTPFYDIMIETELPFLSLIPANYDLFFIENKEGPPIDHALILRDFIITATQKYEYIIIDSPPSLGYLTSCALSVSDFLVIPTQRRIFSFEGLNQLLSLIKRVRAVSNPNLKIAGILFTMIEDEWRASYEAVPDFLASLKGSLFNTVIPWDPTVADASDFGKPGVLYDIGAPGPSAYLHLTAEMHQKLSSFTMT
jgi:chromosome partitioning protein